MDTINIFLKLHKNCEYDLDLYNKKVLRTIVQKHFETYIDEFDLRKDYEFEPPYFVYWGSSPLEHFVINYLYYVISHGNSFKNTDEKIINYLVKLEFKIYPQDTFKKLNSLLDEDCKITFGEYVEMLKKYNINVEVNEANVEEFD